MRSLAALLAIAISSCAPIVSPTPAPALVGTTWNLCDVPTQVTFRGAGEVAIASSRRDPDEPESSLAVPSEGCVGQWTVTGDTVAFDCDSLHYVGSVRDDELTGWWERGVSKRSPVIPGHGAPLDRGSLCMRRVARAD